MVGVFVGAVAGGSTGDVGGAVGPSLNGLWARDADLVGNGSPLCSFSTAEGDETPATSLASAETRSFFGSSSC